MHSIASFIVPIKYELKISGNLFFKLPQYILYNSSDHIYINIPKQETCAANIADAFQMALACLHCLKASLKPSHNVISAWPWAH